MRLRGSCLVPGQRIQRSSIPRRLLRHSPWLGFSVIRTPSDCQRCGVLLKSHPMPERTGTAGSNWSFEGVMGNVGTGDILVPSGCYHSSAAPQLPREVSLRQETVCCWTPPHFSYCGLPTYLITAPHLTNLTGSCVKWLLGVAVQFLCFIPIL